MLAIGEKATLDIDDLIARCNEQGIQVCGGLFPGVLYDEKHSEKGVIIRQVEASQEVLTIPKLSDLDESITLPDLNEETHCAIILLDGLTGKIPLFLERVYEKYWNRLHYIGAGCGSLSLEPQSCVFSNEGFFQDGGIIVFSPSKLSTGVKHGWKKLAGPFIVNSSYNNIVKEINWEPAFQLYQEVIESLTEKRAYARGFF